MAAGRRLLCRSGAVGYAGNGLSGGLWFRLRRDGRLGEGVHHGGGPDLPVAVLPR